MYPTGIRKALSERTSTDGRSSIDGKYLPQNMDILSLHISHPGTLGIVEVCDRRYDAEEVFKIFEARLGFHLVSFGLASGLERTVC